MYKVTNIFTEERGFETDGKMFVLKPKESVIVKKAPEAVEGILKVVQALAGVNAVTAQQVLLISVAIVPFFNIAMIMQIDQYLLTIPKIAALEAGTLDILTKVFVWIPRLAIFGMVVSVIEAMTKAGTYSSKLEEYRNRKYNA